MKKKRAEKYFRHAIELRPKSISYRHGLANILASRNRNLEIQQVYQESVGHHPKSATLRFHHALALVKCKYFTEAEMEFKNAIKLNSNSAQIYHEYAKFCERHRIPPDYKKATTLYFKACSCDPVKYLKAAVDAANLMRRLDTDASLKSAEQLFSKLVAEAPHLNEAYLGYAKLLVRKQRFNEAEETLKTGLKYHPKDDGLLTYSFDLQQLVLKVRTHHSSSASISKHFRPSVRYDVSGNNALAVVKNEANVAKNADEIVDGTYTSQYMMNNVNNDAVVKGNVDSDILLNERSFSVSVNAPYSRSISGILFRIFCCF